MWLPESGLPLLITELYVSCGLLVGTAAKIVEFGFRPRCIKFDRRRNNSSKATGSLRLKNVKLLPGIEIHRVSKRCIKIIIAT